MDSTVVKGNSTIKLNEVTLSQNWGASFGDYTYDIPVEVKKIEVENDHLIVTTDIEYVPKNIDFQDLMVAIAANRAAAVETEVTPLTTIIRNRNKELETLGSLLSIFSKAQANFDSDASGSAKTSISGITSDMTTLATEAHKRVGGGSVSTETKDWTKSDVEGMVSMLKSMIDERNNEAQTDMSRLQSLVDRRDESFTTATNLMSAVSDTRSNLIRNL